MGRWRSLGGGFVPHFDWTTRTPLTPTSKIGADWNPFNFIELSDAGLVAAARRASFLLIAERTPFYGDNGLISALLESMLKSRLPALHLQESYLSQRIQSIV